MAYDDSWQGDAVTWAEETLLKWGQYWTDASASLALGATDSGATQTQQSATAGCTLAAASVAIRRTERAVLAGAMLGVSASVLREAAAVAAINTTLGVTIRGGLMYEVSAVMPATFTADAVPQKYSEGLCVATVALGGQVDFLAQFFEALTFPVALPAVASAKISPWDKESPFTANWIPDTMASNTWAESPPTTNTWS